MKPLPIYLHDLPLPEALERWENALNAIQRWGILDSETIPLDEQALGRVLAEPIWARISSPHYHASAMDGFAVRSDTTSLALPASPVLLACDGANGPAAGLDTGDVLPLWADAVVPIENTEALDENLQTANDPRRPAFIRLRSAVAPWAYVRPMGEDFVISQLVLPGGQVLRPVDLGAIAAAGHDHVRVTRKPRVAILPTGTELAPVGKYPLPGEIIEFNSIVLAAQVNAWGGLADRFPPIADDPALLRRQIEQAAQNSDLILVNAGSSAGSQDYTASVLEQMGKLIVHGVAVRPGHPVILGLVEVDGDLSTKNQIPLVGVPGYPVSAALTGEIFIEPLLARWTGRRSEPPTEIQATLIKKVTSPPGDDDYLRVSLGWVGERLLAAPLGRGAGVISSLIKADGLVVVPRGVQGLSAGSQVQVRLCRSSRELEETILAVGSHDLSLDLLTHYLSRRQRRLASSNVGSLGGLLAIQRREAHLAGSHLLDPVSGEYNLSYLRQYLPGWHGVLVQLVKRQQGLMVRRGNPLGISSLADLARPDVRFINRQKGAGTRVLLDYHLHLTGLAPESIRGYNQEEFTHLSVAVAVAAGRVDCGLGIAAAAQALDLEFLPLFVEDYQLVIPQEEYVGQLLYPLLDILTESDFRRELASLPGYDVAHMGEAVAEF